MNISKFETSSACYFDSRNKQYLKQKKERKRFLNVDKLNISILCVYKQILIIYKQLNEHSKRRYRI